MINNLKYVVIHVLFLSVIFYSCLPTYINSMRLYERNSGKTINVILEKSKYNRGTIYTSQHEADQGGEIFDGEYYIHGRNFKPDARTEMFMNEAKSIAEEYGFGKNAAARPAGTGIITGSQGTVIEIILYNVQGELKSGDGIGRDNDGNYYRVYLSEEQI